MKKCFIFVAFALLVSSLAYADIFKAVGAPEKLKSSEALSISGVDSATILGEATQILGYLSPKEGMLLDKWGTTNYLSTTIITYAPWDLSLNAGVTGDPLNPDGGAGTVDWNLGKYIPSMNVPILDHITSATIGGGFVYRDKEKSKDDPTLSWQPSWALTGQIKTTW